MQIVRINSLNFSEWEAQIEGLLTESFYMNFPGHIIGANYSKDRCRKIAGYLVDGTAVIFAAVSQQKLVGWIWCHPISRMGEKRLHVSEIAVTKVARGRGIGQRLLSAAEEYAKIKEYQEIDLMVTISNTDAVHFYQKASFIPERYQMKKCIREPGSKLLNEVD